VILFQNTTMTPKIPYTNGATVWKKNPPVLGSIYANADVAGKILISAINKK
jgi:hypothetical protein